MIEELEPFPLGTETREILCDINQAKIDECQGIADDPEEHLLRPHAYRKIADQQGQGRRYCSELLMGIFLSYDV